MGYADELLTVARNLADLHPTQAHQPSLRRALSTGYYALFHLLIEDAIEPCGDPHLKYSLSRMFDHGPMKQVCDKTTSELNSFFETNPPDGPQKIFNDHLATVAEAFSQGQHNRNDADYNRSKEWDAEQVGRLLDGIEEAFQSWRTIREDSRARTFLTSMLQTRERRPPDPSKRKSLTDPSKT
jgi:hypothetical protein